MSATDEPATLLGSAGLELADELDATDDVESRRHLFVVPDAVAYLAGNSLGLQPLAVRGALEEVLDGWAALGVAGHHEGPHPWVSYHETMRETVARLVGARPGEAVVMNSLTVNLHLLMASFYRPTASRHRIVIEADVFPSDRYAFMSVARAHGFDPDEAVVILSPRDRHLGVDDFGAYLDRHGESVSIVALSGVDFRTGALLDIPAITAVAHRAGAVAIWDVAHVAGNVPLRLHDWDVDAAVWCHYKYVNAGPGAVGGLFIHERHGSDPSLVRPGGWWGHDPASRFDMPFGFRPQPGAAGWQISNPPILAMAPVRVALEIFDTVGMDALRARSIRLTGFLERLLDAVAARRPLNIVSPRDPARRGAQLSVEVDDARRVNDALYARHGVRCDDRPPNIIRVAPAPLYNTFNDCWRAAVALDAELARTR
jgi:kynureninase